MAEFIAPIQRLVEQFRKLPGVGAKTASRYAFSVLSMDEESVAEFSQALSDIKHEVKSCPRCFGLTANDGECDICSSSSRDGSVLCVVENPKDIIVMERVRGYKGHYHVLGGALSPLDNITPDDLKLSELVSRVESGEVKEVIIATNPTPGGDTTAAYIARILEPCDVKVSRLAYGIPVGGDIEYADEVTLYRAMEGRRYF